MTTTKMKKFCVRFLPLAVVVAMIGIACSGLQPQAAPPGERPVSPSEPVNPPISSQVVAVFFADWQAQHLIPEMRQVPQAAGAVLVNQVVKELLAGPQDPHLLRVIPPDVRLLEPVKVENGTATVNLSKELKQIQGTAGAISALNSLQLTLTEIANIQKVQVLIEGSKEEDLQGLTLGPMERILYLYPVFVDPERVEYLQGRSDQSLDPWRADPLKVAQWEGRMFGFTAAALGAAKVEQNGTEAKVKVTQGSDTYTILLAQNPRSQKSGIWSIRALDLLVGHSRERLDPAMQAWVDRYAETTIGHSRMEGGRTYLIAAVEAGGVRIDSALVKEGKLVVYVMDRESGRVDIASFAGEVAGLPVEFQWKVPPTGAVAKVSAPDLMPALHNPNGLAEAALTGKIAVISPVANQRVTGSIAIKGYARHLFEANLVARLVDLQGKEVAVGYTTAGACCFDWGSFQITLQHNAPAGEYTLELGDYSPRDGAWQALTRIPIRIAS